MNPLMEIMNCVRGGRSCCKELNISANRGIMKTKIKKLMPIKNNSVTKGIANAARRFLLKMCCL